MMVCCVGVLLLLGPGSLMSKKVVERQADYTSCLHVDTFNSLAESQRPSGTQHGG
jgi:hypothetical protein